MTRGRFTAVVYGEFQTTGGGLPVKLVAASVAAVALVSWLTTILVELAVTAGVLAAVILSACWLLFRRNDRDSELLAERAAALHADMEPKAVAPREVHYHVHLAPGQSAEGAIAAVAEMARLPAADETTMGARGGPVRL
jgi:hypothetical protein